MYSCFRRRPFAAVAPLLGSTALLFTSSRPIRSSAVNDDTVNLVIVSICTSSFPRSKTCRQRVRKDISNPSIKKRSKVEATEEKQISSSFHSDDHLKLLHHVSWQFYQPSFGRQSEARMCSKWGFIARRSFTGLGQIESYIANYATLHIGRNR